MSVHYKRGDVISRAVRLVRWSDRQTSPFTWAEIADVGEINRRNAYRWLDALEANGVIEQHGTDRRENGPAVRTFVRRKA